MDLGSFLRCVLFCIYLILCLCDLPDLVVLLVVLFSVLIGDGVE